ncbi:MAG: RpiB/LacA/LacB family sugar-phosphate isomerase [Eubacteriales bacterium]
MNIAMASDKAGFDLKESVRLYLLEQGHQVTDWGQQAPDQPGVPFYEGCCAVIREIQSGRAEKGILFCSSGAGMCILANKFEGIYAIVSESVYSAKYCRIINDCNVLTMGQRMIGSAMAFEMVDAFLSTDFMQGMTPERQVYQTNLIDNFKQLEKKLYHPET